MSKKPINGLDRFFGVTERGSTIRTEILAGLTAFITLSYVLIMNPQIMAAPYHPSNTGVYPYADAVMYGRVYNGVFIATCIASFLGTMLCAVYAKVPYAQAPGMGLNTFFAYTVCLGLGYSYQQALVVVFIAGALFILISLVGLRESIVNAIPPSVKGAITPGIGLFITILGLKNGGIVIADSSTLVGLVDFAQWQSGSGDLSTLAAPLLALMGLALIGILTAWKINGAVIISIVAVTLVGIPLGVTPIQQFTFNLEQQFKDFAQVSLFKLDFAGLVDPGTQGTTQMVLTVLMLVVSFSLVNLFDSIGTLLGAARQADMIDENGNAIRMNEALMADAVSTAACAFIGTSTVSTLVESASGIAAGGRTGLTSLVTSVLFLMAMLAAPLISLIPACATAPALIYVGVLMLANIREVDFDHITDAIPAFCTIVFMPFTYSIANGVAMGLIFHCILKTATGRFREIHPLATLTAMIFLTRYAFMSM